MICTFNMLQRQLTFITLLVLLCQNGVRTAELTTCEGSTATLTCAQGTIKVLTANYGRKDSTTCSTDRPAEQLTNVQCSLASSLSLVANKCDGTQSCSISVGNAIFGDPCGGTYKYLTVSYSCHQPTTTPVPTTAALTPPQQLLTCEGETARLTCAQGTIKVLATNYGRTNSTTCSTGRPAGQLSNVQCFQASSLSLVANKCDGSQDCSIPVGNTIFSDPCSGTYKYLNVSYTCVPQKTSITCQNQQSTISCLGRRTLRIHHANYGRTDVKTCSHPSVNALNFRCISVQTRVLQLWCNGRNHCHLYASNTVFFNRCPLIYKYLEVAYSCI